MSWFGVEKDLCLADTVLRNGNNIAVSAALAATAQRPEGVHG